MSPEMWKFSFVVPHAVAEAFSQALQDAYEPEALAVTTSEANEGEVALVATSSDHNEIEALGFWRIDVLYADEPDTEVLHALMTPIEVATGCAASEWSVEIVPDIDWVKKSLEGLGSVHAGRFVLHGGHDWAGLPASAIPILVDAGQAFGTGHHETTQGCLEYISELVQPGKKLNALDLGTGTGALAIAIAKLARCSVIASDIDPVATGVALANSKTNGVASLVKAITAAGFGHPALRRRAPYDLIVANILARPLVKLAPSFRRYLALGGSLVLSGILANQESMVTSACRQQGLYLVSRKPMGEWVTLRIGN